MQESWLTKAYTDLPPTFCLPPDKAIVNHPETLKSVITFLKSHPEITTLEFPEHKMDIPSINHLASVLSTLSLTSVDFSENKLTDETFISLSHVLKNCSKLQSLNFNGNQITQNGIKIFSDLFNGNQALLKLNLIDNKITSEGIAHLSAAFQHNPFIQLNVSHNPIGSGGAEILSVHLSKKIISELRLSKNNIDDKGIAALSIALESHSSITKLVLSKNTIGQKSAEGLRSVLQNNHYIRMMDLSGNNIGATEAETLAAGLKGNSGIEILNLSFNNKMQTSGISAILKNLEEHPTLNSLYLIASGLGDNEAESVALFLTKNTTITSLNISSNNIQTPGGKLISMAFEKNQRLENFDVSSNPIGDASAILFAESLKKHSNIKELSLSNTNIGTEGLFALAPALKTHKTLTRFEVDLVPSDNDTKTKNAQEALINALEQNFHLNSFEFRCKKISEVIKNKADTFINRNIKLMQKEKSSEFIQIVILLIRSKFLPEEAIMNIIRFLCLSLGTMPKLWKSHQQLQTCANFIFNNREEINEKISGKKEIKMIEKISTTGESTFSFFKPALPIVPMQTDEETNNHTEHKNLSPSTY